MCLWINNAFVFKPFKQNHRKSCKFFYWQYWYFSWAIWQERVVMEYPEAVAQRCSVKNVFLGISQNSQENIFARVSFLIKLQASDFRPATLLKKRLWSRCFPMNFAKFLRTPFLQNSSGRLLLYAKAMKSMILCKNF